MEKVSDVCLLGIQHTPKAHTSRTDCYQVGVLYKVYNGKPCKALTTGAYLHISELP